MDNLTQASSEEQTAASDTRPEELIIKLEMDSNILSMHNQNMSVTKKSMVHSTSIKVVNKPTSASKTSSIMIDINDPSEVEVYSSSLELIETPDVFEKFSSSCEIDTKSNGAEKFSSSLELIEVEPDVIEIQSSAEDLSVESVLNEGNPLVKLEHYSNLGTTLEKKPNTVKVHSSAEDLGQESVLNKKEPLLVVELGHNSNLGPTLDHKLDTIEMQTSAEDLVLESVQSKEELILELESDSRGPTLETKPVIQEEQISVNDGGQESVLKEEEPLVGELKPHCNPGSSLRTKPDIVEIQTPVNDLGLKSVFKGDNLLAVELEPNCNRESTLETKPSGIIEIQTSREYLGSITKEEPLVVELEQDSINLKPALERKPDKLKVQLSAEDLGLESILNKEQALIVELEPDSRGSTPETRPDILEKQTSVKDVGQNSVFTEEEPQVVELEPNCNPGNFLETKPDIVEKEKYAKCLESVHPEEEPLVVVLEQNVSLEPAVETKPDIIEIQFHAEDYVQSGCVTAEGEPTIIKENSVADIELKQDLEQGIGLKIEPYVTQLETSPEVLLSLNPVSCKETPRLTFEEPNTRICSNDLVEEKLVTFETNAPFSNLCKGAYDPESSPKSLPSEDTTDESTKKEATHDKIKTKSRQDIDSTSLNSLGGRMSLEEPGRYKEITSYPVLAENQSLNTENQGDNKKHMKEETKTTPGPSNYVLMMARSFDMITEKGGKLNPTALWKASEPARRAILNMADNSKTKESKEKENE